MKTAEPESRKIGARWHRRIDDPTAAQPGDFVEYRGGSGYGRFWARVSKVTRRGLRIEAVKYSGHIVRASRLVRAAAVVSLWRKRSKTNG